MTSFFKVDHAHSIIVGVHASMVSLTTSWEFHAESSVSHKIASCCSTSAFPLLRLYLFFIFAIHSTGVRSLCMLEAALLQYFLPCMKETTLSCMVMAAEHFKLYIKLVVFLGSEISHYALKAALTSCGMATSWGMSV